MTSDFIVPLLKPEERDVHFPVGLSHRWNGPWEVFQWRTGNDRVTRQTAHFVLGSMNLTEARATIAELGTKVSP